MRTLPKVKPFENHGGLRQVAKLRFRPGQDIDHGGRWCWSEGWGTLCGALIRVLFLRLYRGSGWGGVCGRCPSAGFFKTFTSESPFNAVPLAFGNS